MKNHLLNPKQQNFQNSRYYSLFSKPINPVDRVKEILPWKVSPSEHKSFKQNLQKTSLNSYFIYTVCVIVPSLLLTFRIFPLLVESIVLLRDACAKQTTQLKVYYHGRQPSSFAPNPPGLACFLCNNWGEGVAFHSFATKQAERQMCSVFPR